MSCLLSACVASPNSSNQQGVAPTYTQGYIQNNVQSNVANNTQSYIPTQSIVTEITTEDPKEADKRTGQEVYDKLININSTCDKLGSIVYDAWYFAIYKSKDVDVFSSGMQEFATAIGLSQSLVEQATQEYLTLLGYTSINDIHKLAAVRTNDGAIFISIRAYKLSGKLNSIEDDLTLCKEKLKEMSPDYDSYTKLSTLQSLYSNVSDYFDFVYSPSGSFNSLSSTLNSYKKDISANLNNLEFVYG